MRYIIKHGRVIDPANKIDGELDILVAGGSIEKAEKSLTEKCDKVIDAKGRIVAPGLVDLHAHLREPGREDKETVASGTRAAVRGGFTTVTCMPNTEPAIDSPEVVRRVRDIVAKDALCNVAIAGAITLSRAGKRIADFAKMKEAGAVAVSDDGSSVADSALMEDALKAAALDAVTVMCHCEDAKLSAQGVVNMGFISTKMGLKGISSASEYEIVARDIELAAKTGAAVHICHVSCKESVELIRRAKSAGVRVTAETAPHYFALTEDCCVTYDTNMKMNPPLRSKEDADALRKAIADGTIDAIATDHAPHTDSEKDVEFDYAPFGVIGLETALSLSIMELVDSKIVSWSGLISKLSYNPAKILGLKAGTLSKGAPADIVIIDPNKEYIYKKELIESKSKNSPFIGWSLKGKVTDVFVGGKRVMEDEEYRQPCL
ncbi:MAG: dihydroorotase [Candidatus Omnitrophica bacterium]|nr:dihydroorotase [Candidatus Omnitrophota bacterium]